MPGLVERLVVFGHSSRAILRLLCRRVGRDTMPSGEFDDGRASYLSRPETLVFPPIDRSNRNPKRVGKLLLRHSQLPPKLSNEFTHVLFHLLRIASDVQAKLFASRSPLQQAICQRRFRVASHVRTGPGASIWRRVIVEAPNKRPGVDFLCVCLAMFESDAVRSSRRCVGGASRADFCAASRARGASRGR